MDWVAASRTVKISGLVWSNCWHRSTCLLLVSPPESCRRRQPVVGSYSSQCKEQQFHEWEMERAIDSIETISLKCFTLPPFITAAMTTLHLPKMMTTAHWFLPIQCCAENLSPPAFSAGDLHGGRLCWVLAAPAAYHESDKPSLGRVCPCKQHLCHPLSLSLGSVLNHCGNNL